MRGVTRSGRRSRPRGRRSRRRTCRRAPAAGTAGAAAAAPPSRRRAATTSAYASSTRGRCGSPNSASIARSASRWPPYAAGSITRATPSSAQMHVAVPEVAVQPGGRLLGQQVGRAGRSRPRSAAASSSVACAAVAGQLEVGQHPPGRVELRPGRRGPVRQRQPADEAVLLQAVRRRRRPRAVAASAWPNATAASTVGLAGLDPAQDQALVVGRRAPRARRRRRPRPASAGRAPRPRRSPRGRAGCVFISAVVPSLSRSRVAVEMSPPATGAVATTDEPRSSSARLATSGRRVIAGRARACSAATIASVVRSTMREDLLEPVGVHRSTGPARPPRSRRGRSRGTVSTRSSRPPMSARLVASIASTRSYVGRPAVVVLAGAVPAGVVARRRSGWRRPARPSGRRRASRRCRCWTPRPGRRARPPPASPRARLRPSASGRCCRGRRR